jgi:putative heme-binding domain-containing protein
VGSGKVIWRTAALLLGAVFTWSALAQDPPASKGDRLQRGRDFLGLAPPADPAAAARGEKLFVANCGFCHGNNAKGAEGPDLLRSSVVLHDEKGELIAPVVLAGRPAKGMPAFASMSPAQIYDIAEFLHSRVEAAANRYGYRIQNVVTGDAAAGQTYFKQSCSQCHAAAGDLAHIGSKFEAVALQARFLYPDEAVKKQKARITTADGKTISGVVKRIDDFDIAIFDEAGVYHSWPREKVKVEMEDPLKAHRELLAHYSDADMHNLLAYLVTLK